MAQGQVGTGPCWSRVHPGRWLRSAARRLPGAKGRILRAAEGRLGRGLTEGDAGRLSRMIVGSRARRSGCLTGCVTAAGRFPGLAIGAFLAILSEERR